MRKWILALVGLLVSSSAQAHVSAVPFSEVGSLHDAHKAAFAIFQTYAGPPQIFYNIVSDGGAACNGDVLTVTRTASITTGTKNLGVTVNTFSSGDVGKTITIEGAGNSGGRYYGKIATFTDAQNVVLDTNATTTLSAVSTSITYGTSDAPAFDTFNNWARANQGASNQVVLTIPNGSNCWFGNGTFNYISVFNAFAAGINNLIVEGAGATLNSVGGRGFALGGSGVCQSGLTSVNGCSARIQTANPNDTTVTLTADSLAAGYASRFNAVAGQWIMIGGLDIQGLFQAGFGYPPNQNVFEWRQITNVNAGTGVITLDRSLTNYYSADWPNYNPGSNFESDSGGSATIWTVGNSGVGGTQNNWNSTVEYRGLTINQEGQTYANVRNVTYRGVTFGGAFGAVPTQNETWSSINSNHGFNDLETDKLVGLMYMDGVTIFKIVFQSTSTDRFVLKNSTLTQLVGGAKFTEISDTDIDSYFPGTWAYGATGTSNYTTCTRCNITTLSADMGYNDFYDPMPYSMTSGLITMVNSAAKGSAQRPFVPGSKVYYGAALTNPPTPLNGLCCQTIGQFTVTGITADPWPALDNQTVSATVTSTNGSNSISVSGSSFVSGDVGKTIIVPGARSGNLNLNTWIIGVSGVGPQTLTLGDNATRSQTATQTLQWGTSNTYIQTDQAGSFPGCSGLNTGQCLKLSVLGSWNFTCDTCTGDPNAVGSSIQAGATPGAPLGSYITRTFTPTSAQGTIASMGSRGKFVSLRVNVTAAYSGAAGFVILNPGGQFHWALVDRSTPSTPVVGDWLPADLSINLKQAGDRVITPSGVTCNGVAGGCSGDTINLPANINSMWIPSAYNGSGGGGMSPFMGSNYSGGTAPTFTITLQTDTMQ